MLTSVNTAYL